MAGWVRRARSIDVRAFLESCKGGVALPRALRRYAERIVGTDLEEVRVSTSAHVETLEASAVAAGERVVVHPSVWRGFDDEQSLHLLFHELVHVAQQRAGRVPFQGAGIVLDDALESEAELNADRAVRGLALSNLEPRYLQERLPPVPGWFERIALQPHPGSSIIRRGLSWLAKRSTKAISKHIAEHAKRNFSKAIHGVFRSIDKIRPLIRQTLTEGGHLAEHFAQSSGAEAVERAGVKITRQATATPGKVRWVIQKKFPSAIGTKGETVLRVVLDMSGRIVTAFPADKLLTILGTVAATELLTEGIADAAEKVGAEAERLEQLKEMERNKIDLWDFVPWIGAIWGGSLNQFEDLELAYDRYVDNVVRDVITQAERRAGCSFANRTALEEVVRCGLGTPLLLENP
jgi:Domain of unknown function (DUF4157)